MNLKFNLFLLTVVAFVYCKSSALLEIAPSAEERLMSAVANLVSTWNKRHSEKNDVLVFDLESDKSYPNEFLARISKENTILLSKLSETLPAIKPSFCIILSSYYNEVE